LMLCAVLARRYARQAEAVGIAAVEVVA